MIDCLRTLIAYGADIDAHDDIMRTPLLWAATDGNVALVTALLNGDVGRRADISAQNTRGRTALHLAAADNMVDVVKVLLAHGAPVNASSDGRWTALHNAAQNGHAEVASLLVDAKARVNAQLSNGMTPLHWAAFNGYSEVVDILLRNPETDVTIKDTFHRTPMMCAAESNHKALAEGLSPSRLPSRLPPVAQDACRAFEAKIVDFKFRRGEAQRVFKHSVYDVLYGWDMAQNKPSIPILPVNVKHQPAFRWIHLPANNVSLFPFFTRSNLRAIP
jgi:ankyrin repeat protein